MRRVRRAVLIVGLVAPIAVGSAVAAAVAAGALRPAQTTTGPGVTATLAPATTEAPTTAAPTTEAPTTKAPTTTEPVTTTSSATTTTVAPAPAATSSSSSTPWGWIIFALALVAIALITVLVVLARNRNRAKREWKDGAASVLRDADLVRDMLAGEARPGEPEEVERVAAVRDNVERVAIRFDELAQSAPSDEMRQSSTSVASSLRGYFFALEAEQLLHEAPTSPTADQLASADATKRARAADLQEGVDKIRAYVAPDPKK